MQNLLTTKMICSSHGTTIFCSTHRNSKTKTEYKKKNRKKLRKKITEERTLWATVGQSVQTVISVERFSKGKEKTQKKERI